MNRLNQKPIPGFNQYLITDDGRVYSLFLKDYLKPTICNDYLSVTLVDRNQKKHTKYLHRLVAEAFCYRESPLKDRAIHLDGNKLNNVASNLRWMTALEAWEHGLKIGTHTKTREHLSMLGKARKKLTDEQIVQMKAMLDQGHSKTAVAKTFGICVATVNNYLK